MYFNPFILTVGWLVRILVGTPIFCCCHFGSDNYIYFIFIRRFVHAKVVDNYRKQESLPSEMDRSPAHGKFTFNSAVAIMKNCSVQFIQHSKWNSLRTSTCNVHSGYYELPVYQGKMSFLHIMTLWPNEVTPSEHLDIGRYHFQSLPIGFYRFGDIGRYHSGSKRSDHAALSKKFPS